VKLYNKVFLGVIVLFILTGCATTQARIGNVTENNIFLSEGFEDDESEVMVSLPKKHLERKKFSSSTDTPPILNANIEIFKGDVSSKKLDDNSKSIKLSVDNITIPKFTKLVYGQILGVNFVMDATVEHSQKHVTLNIVDEVSREVFIDIVEKLYESNGFYVEYSNHTFYIKKGKNKYSDVQGLGSHILYGKSLPKNLKDDEVVSIFIPYHYVYLSRIKGMFKNFLSKESYQKDFKEKNVYLIRDRVKNLRQVLRFIRTVDVPVMKKKITRLYKLEYIDVKTFYKTLEKVLPSSGIKIAKKLSDLGVILEPIENLNSLFVVSDKYSWIKTIEYWKRKLDVISVNNNEGTFFVYQPKNRISTELKKLLDGLASPKKGLREETPKEEKPIESFDTFDTLNMDEVRVIDDTNRNMLIIYATPTKYRLLLDMLKKLDVLPKQVLIEVTIAELTLKDSLENGFEWYMRNHSGTGVLSTIGGLGLGGAGLSGSIVNNTASLQLQMNYFAQKNLINILSSPKIVVVDNQSASLNVGTDVPILNSSSSTITGTGEQTLSQSVEYRKTGILLNVTPTIHSNNSLMLKIAQTVSEAQANSTSSISSPIVLTRNIDTSVVLKSGQTLMLGGLIRSNKSKTFSKVPLLGDIPYVGELFRTSQRSLDKTELIVLIRPIVLDNLNKANTITHTFVEMLNRGRD
jgi:general secretion pathway protein D